MIALALVSSTLFGAPMSHPTTTSSTPHATLNPEELAWGPVPNLLPAGAQISVLSGDPFSVGTYVIRLRLPDGYRVPPHWHLQDEYVTVLQGELDVGFGDQLVASALKPLEAGGLFIAPGGHTHFVQSRGESVLQINGTGPFDITYVNPVDDPRNH